MGHFWKKISKELHFEIFLIISIVLINFFFLKKEKTAEEIVIEILLIALFLIISFLFSYMTDLNNIDYTKIKGKLDNISSNKLKSIAKYYIPKEVEKIEKSLMNLLNADKTSSILWELKYINLQDLETSKSFSSLSIQQQNKMIQSIYSMRRKRITRIANELITLNGKYFTTETNKPSTLEKYDAGFWDKQKDLITLKKPIEARRFLIIKKDELINEYKNHSSALQKYIDFNNFNYNKGWSKSEKSIIFHIIVYFDKIDDVFCGSNIRHQLYDFTISTKKNKTTVFAQTSDAVDNNAISELSAFDSENEQNNISYYVNWYDNMIKNKENTLLKNSDCNHENKGYIKSKEIKSINDVEDFINFISQQPQQQKN